MRKVRWGVIGAGGIADRKTIPGLLAADNCELVAVMDIVNAEKIANKYQVKHYTDSIEELLARQDVDAVYIATPVDLHPEQVKSAAAAGKHVLCEKPLAANYEQAKAMVNACKSHGVLLQEGYMMRFHGAHQRISQIINEGKIGKPVYARAQLSCWYPPIEGAWRQDPNRGGGGALIDMASHLYDLLEMFFGPVQRVCALAENLVHGYPVDDASTTLLKFKSGPQATVDCFFCIPDLASPTRLEIYGSAGGILTEGTIGQGDGGKAWIYLEQQARGYDATQNKDLAFGYLPLEYEKVNMYTAECRSFAECILEGKPVEINDGEHGLHIIRLVEAAYRSAQSGHFEEVIS